MWSELIANEKITLELDLLNLPLYPFRREMNVGDILVKFEGNGYLCGHGG